MFGHRGCAHSGPSTEWGQCGNRGAVSYCRGGSAAAMGAGAGNRRRAICAEPTLQEFNLFNIFPGKEENK